MYILENIVSTCKLLCVVLYTYTTTLTTRTHVSTDMYTILILVHSAVRNVQKEVIKTNKLQIKFKKRKPIKTPTPTPIKKNFCLKYINT